MGNLLLKQLHTYTHTQVLSLCLPEHSLHSLCCCLFESGSVILDQRVQRAPECWWCKLCVQCLPRCSTCSHVLPGGLRWDREERPCRGWPWRLQTDTLILWDRLMGACLLCLRGLLLMTWDTVGRRKCWPARSRGMWLSCGEWWIGSVWPGEQTERLSLPLLLLLCLICGRPRCLRWVLLGKHLPSERLWRLVISNGWQTVCCESCHFISLCMHCSRHTVSLSAMHYLNVLCTVSCVVSFDCMEISGARCACLWTFGCALSQVYMDLQDSSHTMWGLNARLKGFLEQVNRLQETNQRLEAQITDWGIRSTSRSRDWSQQEQTVNELRAQVRLRLVVVLNRSCDPLKSLSHVDSPVKCPWVRHWLSAGVSPQAPHSGCSLLLRHGLNAEIKFHCVVLCVDLLFKMLEIAQLFARQRYDGTADVRAVVFPLGLYDHAQIILHYISSRPC